MIRNEKDLWAEVVGFKEKLQHTVGSFALLSNFRNSQHTQRSLLTLLLTVNLPINLP